MANYFDRLRNETIESLPGFRKAIEYSPKLEFDPFISSQPLFFHTMPLFIKRLRIPEINIKEE